MRPRLALGHPWLPAWLAALAVVLGLPSLGAGLGVDDWWHRLVLLGRAPAATSGPWAMGLFRFVNGDPERTRQTMDRGILPWWTWPELKAAFVRPVAELSHRLDYALWPDSPWAMHLHNLVWFGMAAALVALVYRRLMGGTWVAGLAALLWTIDDCRGSLVGWVANRNSLMALVFALAAALAHLSWRRQNKRASAVAACTCLLLGLLASESAVGILPYLLAYALVLERGTLARRLSSLAPYVVVTAAWWLLNRQLGYGMEGTSVYVDPLAHPLRFVEAVIDRAPILLLSQWAQPAASLHLFVSPAAVAGLQIAGVLVCAIIAGAMVNLWRAEPLARFWALGMALSLLPICATFPHERLLGFVGLGAMGLLAMWLGRSDPPRVSRTRRDEAAPRIPGARRTPWLRALLVTIHLVLAPLLFVPSSWTTALVSRVMQADSRDLPLDPAIATQTWVFISSPVPFLHGYLPILRSVHDQPAPKYLRVLAPSNTKLTVHRPDEHTLTIRARRGYLTAPLDTLFRDAQHALKAGARVKLTDCTITVESATADGRPQAVSFRFAHELESAQLAWFVHHDGRFEPFALPPIGHSRILEPEPLVPLVRWVTN